VPGVEWLGRKPLDEIYDLLGEAAVLIFPSEWYETLGRVAIEAYAKGTPVIAAKIGAIAEVVEHGRTGLLFEPGDPDSLAACVEWAWTHRREMAKMGEEARREYEAKYGPEGNYCRLMELYALATARARERR
jgi:glycosyltransferase involved in cell wall biosynthesis